MIELRRRYNMADGQSGIQLPDEYQRVEYLQGDKKAFINLNIILQKGDRIKFTSTNVNDIVMCVGTVDGTKQVGAGWNQQYVLFYYNTNYKGVGPITSYGNIYTIEYKWDDKFSISLYDSNGVLVITNEEISTIDFIEKPLYVFACNNNTSPLAQYAGKIYNFELHRNNGKMVELVPCYRKADNVAGMYDIVNGEFHTNAGTGEFIVGPDVIG